MATQNFKRNLFLNLYREGKKILLVCFLLPLKGDKNVWHLQAIFSVWRPLAFLPVTLSVLYSKVHKNTTTCRGYTHMTRYTRHMTYVNACLHLWKFSTWRFICRGLTVHKYKNILAKNKNLQWLFLHACMLSCFSRVWLFATPWTIAHQATLSMGFSRQEYWSGLLFLSPGDLPSLGIEGTSLLSP